MFGGCKCPIIRPLRLFVCELPRQREASVAEDLLVSDLICLQMRGQRESSPEDKETGAPRRFLSFITYETTSYPKQDRK